MCFQGTEHSTWEDAIKELGQVRESVAHLASLVEHGPPESATAERLIKEILGSISAATAILESGKGPASPRVNSPSSCVTGSKQMRGGKRVMQSTRKTNYRRRANPYTTLRKVTSATVNDGHSWRKYGQKDIFGSKFPRNYYRCTYKFDRDCKASRQVQKSEDDPSLYVITYFGEHTCRNAAKSSSPRGEPRVISFDVKQETQSTVPSLGQEGEEEVVSNLTSIDSPSDYFASLETKMTESGPTGAQHIGSSSCSNSSIPSYDIEFLDLDDLLYFDHPCDLLHV
ncbi:hypothetical protein HPP92_017364 [Vanilla planifolia]|uniref:WRKY domain-containing protein n=1 Tax=Vanilla planifolia TaxID=51239 RepID=A0A835Q7V6_VANPL|nr:hypothetical protein HPP92_017364 [Vanilla planifolia]